MASRENCRLASGNKSPQSDHKGILRKRHRQRHELAADGIERKPHGFESVSTKKGAILFLSENHRRPAHTILVLEKAPPICRSMVCPFAMRNVCALRGLIP